MDLEERITKLMATLAQVTQDLEDLRKDVRSSRPKPSSSGKQTQLSPALNTPTADLSKPGSSSTKPIKTELPSPKPDLSSKIMKATTTPKAPSAALTHSSTTSATSFITQVNAQKEEVDDVPGHGKKRKIELEDTAESEAGNKKPKLGVQESEGARDKRPKLNTSELEDASTKDQAWEDRMDINLWLMRLATRTPTRRSTVLPVPKRRATVTETGSSRYQERMPRPELDKISEYSQGMEFPKVRRDS